MRNILTALVFLTFTSLTSNLARAKEPTPPPLPPISTSNPGTYFVVLGSDSYVNAPGLTGAEGATYDCQAITDHLTQKLHYPETQVMSLCGPELVRDRLFRQLSNFLVKGVPAGSTAVVIWIGHGGTEPGSGVHLWATSDASFSLYPGAEGEPSNTGYKISGITPDVLYREMTRVVPVNTTFVFITDTARGGTYDAGGKSLELTGPSADDFEKLGMKNVYALSPTPSKPVPTGLTRRTIISCLNPEETGFSVTTRELIGCYADGMTREKVTIESTGAWTETNYLIVFLGPPVPTPPVVTKSMVNVPKITLVVAGSTLAAVGVTESLLGYAEAIQLGAEISGGAYGVEGDPKLTAAVERYNTLGKRQSAWYAMSGVGLGALTVGIALPNPKGNRTESPRVTLYLSPTGVVVRGPF